jgi:hypothetical protein
VPDAPENDYEAQHERQQEADDGEPLAYEHKAHRKCVA